ncbi:MAG: cyclodeaminase/cyclohydrolase family protein, partial [Thermoguttaceae bacterium]|nr:cyclodeaminase/cyclohydrolase family protein [Thermoguttaceae bacterium]
REELLAAADADARGFEAVIAAYRLPRALPEEKAARAAAVEAALKAACADFSLGRGENPVAFSMRRDNKSDTLVFAPNVCFESSISHYVRSQVRELTAAGAAPDVLVNISNDGWFRNGLQIDLHLATQVFRAVENRKSVVSATHGGFSAWVDPLGRVRAKGARGGTEIVAAEIFPILFQPATPYCGDYFSAICACVALFVALVGVVGKLARNCKSAAA